MNIPGRALRLAALVMPILFLTPVSGAEAGDAFARTITAVHADAAPRIDGLPDDACWQGAAKASNFQLSEGPGLPPEEPACVALAWDKECLYLYFTCYDHRMAALHAKETKRDGAVWKDDDIELFLAEEGKTGYYQFAVNTLNTQFDAMGPGDGTVNIAWNSSMRSAVTLHTDRWQGEIAVPWRDIGIAPSSGGTLKVNVGRQKLSKPDYPGENTSLFKPADGRWHNASGFGRLSLADLKRSPYFTLENQAELAKDRAARRVTLQLANLGESFQTVRAEILSDGEPVFAGAVQARSAGTDARAVEIPFTSQARGRQEIRLTLSDAETGQIIAGNDYGMASRYGGSHKARYISRKEGYQLWHTGSTQKILPGDEIESQGESREIDISLAKNEYEPFQLVITPGKGKSLTGLTLSFTDLKGESATLGKENITWNLEGYIDIKKVSLNRDAVAGLWPDPLLKGSGFNITEDRHYPMWVTVYAPPNTPAGLYSGTARLQQNGRDMESFNLRVRVWDFSLPDISNLTGIADVWFYGDMTRQVTFADMVRNVKRHKFASTGRIAANSGMSANEYFNEYGMRHAFFPGFSGEGGWDRRRALFDGLKIEPKDPEYRRKFIEWARGIWKTLEAQGCAEKVSYYLWDEPFWASDAQLRENLPLYGRLVREALPGMNITLADYNLEEPAFKGIVDTWTYPLHFGTPYTVQRGEKVQRRGERVMAYDNGLYLIDLPAVNARMYPWMLWKYRFDGFLIWSVNSWSLFKYQPWEGKYLGPNGDGCLIYPDPEKKGVLASIRWELLRDGLEDYDYIYLVESAVKSGRLSAAEQEKGRALIKEAESLITGLSEFTRDTERIYGARRRMGDFLSGLSQRLK